MFGFGKEKLPPCPHCGGKLTRTGYAYPCEQLRCQACIDRNRAKREQKSEMETLRQEVRDLKRKVNER